jgi:hypothetical protein
MQLGGFAVTRNEHETQTQGEDAANNTDELEITSSAAPPRDCVLGALRPNIINTKQNHDRRLATRDRPLARSPSRPPGGKRTPTDPPVCAQNHPNAAHHVHSLVLLQPPPQHRALIHQTTPTLPSPLPTRPTPSTPQRPRKPPPHDSRTSRAHPQPRRNPRRTVCIYIYIFF